MLLQFIQNHALRATKHCTSAQFLHPLKYNASQDRNEEDNDHISTSIRKRKHEMISIIAELKKYDMSAGKVLQFRE